MRQHVEAFKAPIELRGIIDLKTQLEGLQDWDQEYFKRRENIIRELEDMVNSLGNSGITVHRVG